MSHNDEPDGKASKRPVFSAHDMRKNGSRRGPKKHPNEVNVRSFSERKMCSVRRSEPSTGHQVETLPKSADGDRSRHDPESSRSLGSSTARMQSDCLPTESANPHVTIRRISLQHLADTLRCSAQDEQMMRSTTKEGHAVSFVKTEEGWKADIVERCGALVRTRRLPVVVERCSVIDSHLLAVCRLPESLGRRRIHVVDGGRGSPSRSAVFVGERGMKGGAGGDDESGSGATKPQRADAAQMLEVLGARRVESVEALVDAFEASKEPAAKEALLECLRKTIFVFNRMDHFEVTSQDSSVLSEYGNLARLRSTDDVSNLKRDFVDSLRRKLSEDTSSSLQLVATLKAAVASVHPSSYTNEPASLVHLCIYLIRRLDPSETAYTEQMFSYEGELLQLLHVTLTLIWNIDRETIESKQPTDLFRTFVEWNDSVRKNVRYYPARHLVLLIEQSLSWLKSAGSSERSANNTRMMLLFLSGAMLVAKMATKIAFLDFDTDSASNWQREVLKMGRQAIRSEQWYNYHLALENACLMTLKDAGVYGEFFNLLQQLPKDLAATNSDHLKEVSYSALRCLHVLAVRSDARHLRLASTEAIATRLAPPNRAGEWTGDGDLADAALSMLSNISQQGVDAEAVVARQGIEKFVEQASACDRASRALRRWTGTKSLEERIMDFAVKKAPRERHELFSRLEKDVVSEHSTEKGKTTKRVALRPPPAVWFFAAREQEMDELMKAFKEAPKKGKLVTKVLLGPGGIGKSQIAANVFRSLVETKIYTQTYWIPSHSEESLKDSFREIAARLGIEIDPRNVAEAVQETRHRLEDSNCFMVFDDAISGSSISQYVPEELGSVLITSRNSRAMQWRVKPTVIGAFELEDTLKLCESLRLRVDEDFKADMIRVLEHIPRYPLCQVQFLAGIDKMGFSPTEWLECYNKLRSEARMRSLIQYFDDGRREMSDAKLSLPAIVETTIGRMREGNGEAGEQAEEMLTTMAFVDPHRIPEIWIAQGVSGEYDSLHANSRRALALLEECSLITRSKEDDLVHMHAETQLSVRFIYQEHGGAAVERGNRIVGSIQKYLQQIDERNSKKRTSVLMLPHMRSVYKHIEQKDNEEGSFILGRELIEACELALDYTEREQWARNNVKLAESGVNIDKSRTANALSELGNALLDLGRYDEALVNLQRSLEMKKAIHGEEPHPSVATSYNNIGHVLDNLGRYDEALVNLQRSLEMKKAIHGEEPHPSLAASYNNIGLVLDNLGRYDEALVNHQRALEMWKATHGEEPHPSVATSYNNIGLVLDNLGRYDEALVNHQRALEMWKATHGEEPHPNVASSYNNIGSVFMYLGRYDEALVNHQRALEMKKAIHGEEPHPSVATSYNNIGVLLHRQGKHIEAIEEYSKALEIYRSVYPSDDHPNIKRCLSRLKIARQQET